MPNRYTLADHIIIPYGEGVSRTYCGMFTFESSYVLPAGKVCKPCHWNEQSEWENMLMTNNMLYDRATAPLLSPERVAAGIAAQDHRDERKYGVGGQFDTETYRQLFNGFLKDPTELNISTEKPVSQMDNEELTAWIAKLEEFVKVAKVAKQAARVTIEDRKLQMTEEQKKKQAELDRLYKPAVAVKAVRASKSKSPTTKLSEEDKRIKACMDLLGKSETDAIAWLKEKGRL